VTKAQHKAQLRRIIKAWKKRLELEHYTLELEWEEEPEDPDALASIYVSENYDYATLRFRSDWVEHDIDTLNRIVVHELMHIIVHEYGQSARSIFVTGSLSTDIRMMWNDRMHDAEERLVDRVASRLVELGGVVE
jgi:hypothetical protein